MYVLSYHVCRSVIQAWLRSESFAGYQSANWGCGHLLSPWERSAPKVTQQSCWQDWGPHMLLDRELSFPPYGHIPVTTQDNWCHQSEAIRGHESTWKMKVTDPCNLCNWISEATDLHVCHIPLVISKPLSPARAQGQEFTQTPKNQAAGILQDISEVSFDNGLKYMLIQTFIYTRKQKETFS